MIWVLTAGFGDGHNTAARCISEGLRLQAPTEEILVSDLVSEVHPLASDVLKAAYQFAIIRCPWAWRSFYNYLANPGVSQSFTKGMDTFLNATAQRLATYKPRALVSTYPLYSASMQMLRAQGIETPPLVTVITDSVTVHPVWMLAPSDLYLVADEETKEVMVNQYGTAPEIVKVTGFPVSLDFTRQPPAIPRNPAGRILYFPSTPVSHVERTLDALRPLIANGMTLTMPVGKHASRLHHVTRRFMDANPKADFELVGWTNRIPELLQTHDALITKAGGAILHEVLAARIPAVIDYVVPGQEEGNAAMLLDHQCGLRSHSPQETAECVTQLLAGNCKLAATMRENMRPLSIPNASILGAEAVLSLAQSNLS